ncbi:MAG: CYTH domain-containing protein [Clostridiales bacterium]|nr:CYTH domain-containing protein [Clostridiales bacterium]
MQETELKCIINKDVFENIKNAYTWDKIITQENHYYADTSGVLGSHRATFRIRTSGGISRIQIKLHKNRNSPLQICEELEFPINEIPEHISADKAKEYTGLDVGELIRLGSNTTIRHSLMWNETTEICLDLSTYLDCEDYEIEVEYTGELPAKLLDELKALGAEFKENSVGKYTRFIKRFNEVFFDTKR